MSYFGWMKAVTMHRGFTLIELMVSVSIMAILTGVGIAGYNNFNRRQQLRRAADTLATELRSVQKRADSGQRPNGCSGILSEYKVSIGAQPPLTVGVSGVCDSGDIDVYSFDLHPSIELSTNDGRRQLYFLTAQGSGGNAYMGPNTLTLSHSALAGETRIINISANGSIDVE